jgi:hypothetical protein
MEVVEMLLEAGFGAGEKGGRALIRAAMIGRVEIVKMLLKAAGVIDECGVKPAGETVGCFRLSARVAPFQLQPSDHELRCAGGKPGRGSINATGSISLHTAGERENSQQTNAQRSHRQLPMN